MDESKADPRNRLSGTYEKIGRRPRRPEFLTVHCGGYRALPSGDWSCGAIRGQTEHFRANAARKCLVSPRIAAWADSETPTRICRSAPLDQQPIQFFQTFPDGTFPRKCGAKTSRQSPHCSVADSETPTRVCRSAPLDQQPIQFFHTFLTEHFRANAARKCLVSPRIAAWADSETPPPGFAVPRHSTSSRSNFFTASCR